MRIFFLYSRKSFALVELLTVMGIIAILFSLSVPQLFRLRDRNSLQSETIKIISLMRQQQINAMNSSSLYGVHFEQSKYTQFIGANYNSTDSANITTIIDSPIEISQINVPSMLLIFASGSGEIVDFDEEHNSLVIEDSVHHEQNTILFNSLGVPTSL